MYHFFLQLFIPVLVITTLTAMGKTKEPTMTHKKLTKAETRIIVNKGTEAPFTGKYVNHHENGTYTCKRCGAPLFKSDAKFDSKSGWPSFDDAIDGAVKEIPDPDGLRTEIVCANCGAHLGHVFKGEGFTAKDTRHCVNSISLEFMPQQQKTEVAVFAGGCFWGVEYYLAKLPGIMDTTVGYTGGQTPHPTYEQVLTHTTGHFEAVEVRFDPDKISYEKLARTFFEIHDPTQDGGQGPDIGPQYQSAVFYTSAAQKKVIEHLLAQLRQNGFIATTQLHPFTTFWPAEEYHQNYYSKHQKVPYCHTPTNRFFNTQ